MNPKAPTTINNEVYVKVKWCHDLLVASEVWVPLLGFGGLVVVAVLLI